MKSSLNEELADFASHFVRYLEHESERHRSELAKGLEPKKESGALNGEKAFEAKQESRETSVVRRRTPSKSFRRLVRQAEAEHHRESAGVLSKVEALKFKIDLLFGAFLLSSALIFIFTWVATRDLVLMRRLGSLYKQ